MRYHERREIFERLEELERLVRSGHERGGHRDRGRCHHHHDEDDGGGCDFEEKRVIDTIVRLVTEQVGKLLAERHDDRGEDGGGEKRLIDTIVACVSEHVQEIVASELDRRLGRAPLPGTTPAPGTPPPGEPGKPAS